MNEVLSPNAEFVLSATSEIGIGLFGFTGIVFALLGERRSNLLEIEIFTLLMGAAGVIGLSILPAILLSAGASENNLWRYASGIYGIGAIAPQLRVLGTLAKEKYFQARDIASRVFLAMHIVVTIGVVAQFANIYYGAEWLFLALLMVGVTTCLVSFGTLLHRVWYPSDV